MGKKPPSPLFIEWDDSHSPEDGGWLTREQVDLSPMIIQSVGYPIKETRSHITIAAHVTKTCMSGLMTIPKSAILKTKRMDTKISRRARDAAAKVLRDPKNSKKAKVAEGTALTQRVRK